MKKTLKKKEINFFFNKTFESLILNKIDLKKKFQFILL